MSCAITRAAALIVLAGALAGCAKRPATPFEPEAERYRFDIAFAPMPEGNHQYSCTTAVTDLETKQVIAAPRVLTRRPGSAEAKTIDGTTGTEFTVTITFDESGRSATCAAEAQKSGRLIASDRKTLRLPG